MCSEIIPAGCQYRNLAAEDNFPAQDFPAQDSVATCTGLANARCRWSASVRKLVLGKWLQLRPRLVLLDEPTQGIDVGARQEIYDRLLEVCAEGGGIICATSEFEQLEIIAHRVLVFDRGRVQAELKGDRVTKAEIARACYRAVETHAAE